MVVPSVVYKRAEPLRTPADTPPARFGRGERVLRFVLRFLLADS
jgi:hypothetical protein